MEEPSGAMEPWCGAGVRGQGPQGPRVPGASRTRTRARALLLLLLMLLLLLPRRPAGEPVRPLRPPQLAHAWPRLTRSLVTFPQAAWPQENPRGRCPPQSRAALESPVPPEASVHRAGFAFLGKT